MIYRCMHLLIDMSRIVAITQLQDSAIYRRFAIYVANGSEVHKFEARMNTQAGVDLGIAHRELLETWQYFERNRKTWSLNGSGTVIFPIRNFLIGLPFITALSIVQQEGETYHFDVSLLGRADPLTIKSTAAKQAALTAEREALATAWMNVNPAALWSVSKGEVT